MIEWILLFLALVVAPLFLFWCICMPGFIPAGTVVAKCASVKLKKDTVKYMRNGRHIAYKPVIRQFPIVEYIWDDQLYIGTAVLPDVTSKIAPGDFVKVAVNRGSKENVLLVSGPLGSR